MVTDITHTCQWYLILNCIKPSNEKLSNINFYFLPCMLFMEEVVPVKFIFVDKHGSYYIVKMEILLIWYQKYTSVNAVYIISASPHGVKLIAVL